MGFLEQECVLCATHSKESEAEAETDTETETETETEPNSRNLLASLLGQNASKVPKKRAEPLMLISERDHEGGSCALAPWQP